MSDPNYAHRFLSNRGGLCKLIVSGSHCGLSEDAAVHRRHADIECDDLDMEQQKPTRSCCQQARVEVLAAFIKRIREIKSNRSTAIGMNTCQLILDELNFVQPAASDLKGLLREEREKVATRLRHVADGYEQGGHTHRARAFRAIADELGV